VGPAFGLQEAVNWVRLDVGGGSNLGAWRVRSPEGRIAPLDGPGRVELPGAS